MVREGIINVPQKCNCFLMSEPAHPPRIYTSLTLPRSASPNWISNPLLGGILKALRRDPARLADSSGSVRSRMRWGNRLSFLWGSGIVDQESEPDSLREGSLQVR